MADDFATGESGASDTYPIRAGEVKKGSHVVIKGHPCKVIEVTTSKTGKHGHAKANITGVDIFTGNKYVDICPTSHNMTAPNVTRDEFMLADINDEDRNNENASACHLMPTEDTAAKNVVDDREDLFIPDNEEYQGMRDDFEAGKEVIVTVQKAMGFEKILAQYRAKDV